MTNVINSVATANATPSTSSARGKAVEFVVEDVILNYPRLGKAHAPSYEGQSDFLQWSVQAVGISEEDAEFFREVGVTVKETDDGLAVNLKAYVTNADGVASDFVVFDKDANEMSLDDRNKIGYGSKGHVHMYLYRNSYGTVSTRMDFVVVTELVERTAPNKAEKARKLLGL